jgi:pyruvate/2-oxoglutarate dehydrogenase complex dihydrolipoamide dehydrogenase (E3) component
MSGLHFQAVIVGGGSAGYAAARTLAAGGQSVAVVDGARELGGLCILRGCMPTKALLHAAELRHAFHAAQAWGITTGSVTLDVPALFARKDALIADFAGYRRQQLESNRFTLFRTDARFTDPHTLQLGDGRTVTGDAFVLATGSEMAPPPLPALGQIGYLTSDDALHLTSLPESLILLGGGPVTLEFAQFFARLGTRVTVLQRSSQILRGTDPDVAQELERALRREGIEIRTGTELLDFRRAGSRRLVEFQQGGQRVVLEAAEVFHGLGRRPRTAQLGLEAVGVELLPSGHIRTDLHQRTSAPHILAAGDCCGPHEIVHLAVQQGEVAAGTVLRPHAPPAMDYRLLTSVVFTDPGVALVGLSETTARQRGLAVRTAQYPFNDHGKSMILGCQDGFVKLLADATTGELVGGACVGPQAGELIHEIGVAMAARMTARQLAAVPHYHPTLAEIWTYPAEELAELG